MYSFLVSRKDSVGECWYSVERIAEYCNISVNTARRALHWLEEWGYIEIKKSFLGGVQQTNLYKVHRIAAWHQFWESNNIKAYQKKKEQIKQTNQNRYKTWFVSICQSHRSKWNKLCFLLFYPKQRINRGPRKALAFCGKEEQWNEQFFEFSLGNERYVTCDDEKQVKLYNIEQQTCSVSASFGFVLRSPNGSKQSQRETRTPLR